VFRLAAGALQDQQARRVPGAGRRLGDALRGERIIVIRQVYRRRGIQPRIR
jgi:hypothetical protein